MIKLLFLDVDGTLTDGKLYIGEAGETFKVFCVKDGCGIKDILPKHNIIPIVMTARESEIVQKRCKELDIKYFYQNVKNKKEKMHLIIKEIERNVGKSIDLSEIAYIGDDLADVECMNEIKGKGGTIGCPNDAIDEIIQNADYISKKKGGDGAVRDFIEWIIKSKEQNAIDHLIVKINTGKFEYIDLEKLACMWDGKVCIRGAGFIGTGLAFHILKAAGFRIDGYVDINKEVGTKVVGDHKVISLAELKDKKTLFIIAVGKKYQDEVIKELSQNSLFQCVIASSDWEQQIVKSVKEAGDEEASKRYSYWTDDRICAKRWFEVRTGYELNLDNPKTFNEKLQWLKLNDRNSFYTQLVDKYAVKEYVSNIIGKEHIIPTIGIWDDFYEIDFKSLPNQFVLKCTHDSGSSVICLDKNSFDYEMAREKLTKCLNRNYYYVGREWPYKNVKPRILAEEYMVDESGIELKDYKVFNFNGLPKIIQVDFDRYKVHKRNVYDTKWNFIDIQIEYPMDKNKNIEKPVCLQQMLDFSKKLSKNIPFLRTDFYVVKEKIYFGELTFYHGNGMEKICPIEWDAKLGSWIKL